MSSRPNHVQSLKEVIRHSLHRVGGPKLMSVAKKARGLTSSHISGGDLQARFSAIYQQKIWASGGGSLSGPGSDAHASADMSLALGQWLRTLGKQRVTDVGCGDFSWMRSICGCVDYTGVDIVPGLIESLQAQYHSTTCRFLTCDATREELPDGDVAICREILFHLSFADVARILQNIKAHGYAWVVLTTDTEIWFNSDICSGDHRPLNLQRRPYSFGEPVQWVQDDKVARGRKMGIWRAADVLR